MEYGFRCYFGDRSSDRSRRIHIPGSRYSTPCLLHQCSAVFIFDTLFPVQRILYLHALIQRVVQLQQEKKPLRVSSHLQGQQRLRYFLQLPYRFSIPLIIISILMHWVLSQSLFLVVGDKREDETSDLEWEFATVGYSPIAIMFAVIASLFMVAWVVITG
ncbi:hypothetical protein B0J15DRAFT_92026 [Fusarium solani]|uniref:Uncharacterized protein n=1 Tax=Fusarium solani TaxID=169388 RepID=A0A9P9JZ16_FUSSL|nr:uncharacterized protein B0J15DRAFT_92026 [Fusarium solani]KAH7242922.1 hypothetical protein B0J15DRAFT_92026 [Fusarium solani]